MRESGRVRSLHRVLEPLETVPQERRRRLTAALALTIGIESLGIMKDVCHLDDQEAEFSA